MIQENELRVGNLVLYEYHKNKDGLGFQRMTPSLFLALDKLFPIKISEQWLLDFGFKKRNHYYVFGVFGLDIPVIVKNDQFSRYTFHLGDFYVVSIEFIHELQNIYFVLKGEELELVSKH